jgi:hypothetical protein
MSQTSAGRALQLVSKPALTIIESADDYDSVAKSLHQEISPRGVIEQIYVADISAIVWEGLRLRRSKTAIINMAFRAALKNMLVQFWKDPEGMALYQESETLALEWFGNPQARRRVAEILNQFHLDETAIEAEAIRAVAEDLELLERMLLSLEVRRNRALRSIADYREVFAVQVREVSDRIFNTGPILQLQNPAGQRSA